MKEPTQKYNKNWGLQQGKIGFKEFDGNKLNNCPEKGIAQILFNFLVGKPVSEEEEEEEEAEEAEGEGEIIYIIVIMILVT